MKILLDKNKDEPKLYNRKFIMGKQCIFRDKLIKNKELISNINVFLQCLRSDCKNVIKT